MAFFGRDYDENYRPGNYSSRSQWGRSGAPLRPNEGDYYGNRSTQNRGWIGRDRFDTNRYAQDYETLRGGAYGGGYDRGYKSGGYDRGYKSRFQTDYGDPFNDRQQHTPMRVIREDANRYDRGFWQGEEIRSEGSPYPMGYQPYSARTGYDAGYRTGRIGTYNRGPDRGYDRGWF